MNVRRRRISAILLFAALAYLAGAAAGPWLHFHGPAAADVTVQQDDNAPAPNAPLHDPGCAVCHALGAPALLTPASSPHFHFVEAAAPLAFHAFLLAARSTSPPQARAPPLG